MVAQNMHHLMTPTDIVGLNQGNLVVNSLELAVLHMMLIKEYSILLPENIVLCSMFFKLLVLAATWTSFSISYLVLLSYFSTTQA